MLFQNIVLFIRQYKNNDDKHYPEAVSSLILFAFLSTSFFASYITIQGDYIYSFLHDNSLVSLIYGLIYILVCIMILGTINLVYSLGKFEFFKITILLKPIIAGLFFLSSNFTLSLLTLISFFVVSAFEFLLISLLLKKYSSKEHIHAMEGKVFTASGLSFLIFPFIAGTLVDSYSFQGVFAMMVVLSLLSYFFIHTREKDFPNHVPSKLPKTLDLKKTLKDFFKTPILKEHYVFNLILYINFALNGVFLPLYILSLGYNYQTVGIVLAIGNIPSILIPNQSGKIVDKYHNLRLVLSFGFFLIFIGLFGLSFSTLIAPVLLFSFLVKVGSSTMETLLVSSIIEHSTHNTSSLIIFNTSGYIGKIISLFISFIILSFFPLEIAFRSLSFVFFTTATVALSLYLSSQKTLSDHSLLFIDKKDKKK